MKKLYLNFLVLTLMSTALFQALPANAAEIVGHESYTVSWQGIPASDNGNQYQLYYGQVDGNKEAYAVENGLSDRSHEVTLNYLKPCTQYSWSLKTIQGAKAWWSIRDRRFTTGGNCPVTQSTPTSLVVPGNASAVATWETISGARYYTVYYKVCTDSTYISGVKVPENARSLTINYLDPSRNYCYRVAGMLGNKEVWLTEKALTVNRPVLGATDVSEQFPSNSVKKLSRLVIPQPEANDVLAQIQFRNQSPLSTVWTEVKSHTGKMLKAPVSAATGQIEWYNFGNQYPGARQFEIYYKECSASEWQNALVVPGNARTLSLNYLKPGVTYCYKVNVTLGTRSFATEGQITAVN